MHARPVQPFDQRRGLRRRQLHHPVSRAWPTELSIVQALRHQHQPGSVPDQELYPVRPARPEDKQHARERIESELALDQRSEEHTSELQSLMRISYAVFCLKKKKKITNTHMHNNSTNNDVHCRSHIH